VKFKLNNEGNRFYYKMDPNENEARVIVEAIPDNPKAEFKIYAYTEKLPVYEANQIQEEESQATPTWMLPAADIK